MANDIGPDNVADYERDHAGTGWHRPPLLDIEPCDYMLCTLHLMLSLTRLLFKKRILPMLTNDYVAERLNNFICSLGICVPKQTKVGASMHSERSNRIRFTGPDCLKVIERWDEMVDICAKDSTDANMPAWVLSTFVAHLEIYCDHVF